MRNSDNIVRERRNNIIQLLKENGKMSIQDIASTFGTSSITIRRDIDFLESQKMVERSRGAASISKKIINELLPFIDKSVKYVAEKQKIAKKAAELICDGDVVFVNSGTTVLYLPQYISSKNVKIVTNNACMATVDGQENIDLFLTGGERYPKTQSLVGDIALNTISQINANKCIISTNGVSAEQGLTSSFYMETSVNNAMLSRCNGEKIVIADSSKIGKVFSFISARINMIDTLITDSSADKAALEDISSCGVRVIIAE